MYKHVNIVPELISKAKTTVVDNDRMFYAPFLAVVERYCERVCVIGGRVGADLLVGVPLHKDSFSWEIYTNNTYEVARNIADDFMKVHSPHIDVSTVAQLTAIRNIEDSVSVNGRVLVRIYRVSKYRNIDLMQMIRSVIVDGYFGGKVQCLSEEIQLSDIYQTLYSPSKFDKWESSLEIEEKLYKHIEPQFENVYIGGNGSGGINSLSERDEVILAALGDKKIVIGSIAMKLLGLESKISRLQVIIDDPIDDVVSRIKAALTDLDSSADNPIKITAVEYKLHLVSDFRLTKHTLYIVKSSTERQPIMDVFNSTSYELIPTLKVGDGHILAGNLYVLLRFKLIDAWAVKIILGFSSNGQSNASLAGIKRSVAAIIEDIRTLRAEIIKLLAAKDGPQKLFPDDRNHEYVGKYISEKISKKKILEQAGEFFAPYYPAKKSEVEPIE